jgi:hypothetical protein
MGHPESSCRLADIYPAQVNTNVKSSGQECPHHTDKTNFKSDGQQCPSYAGKSKQRLAARLPPDQIHGGVVIVEGDLQGFDVAIGERG